MSIIPTFDIQYETNNLSALVCPIHQETYLDIEFNKTSNVAASCHCSICQFKIYFSIYASGYYVEEIIYNGFNLYQFLEKIHIASWREDICYKIELKKFDMVEQILNLKNLAIFS